MNLPELLAPAGDFAAVDAALAHGADAIYTGIGTLNLRAHAHNFSLEDIPELIERIHAPGKKVYFTLNTMPDDHQIDEVMHFLSTLKRHGNLPDAFIVSDPGVVDLCKDIVPEIALHLSTQSGTFNRRSLSFWKKRGISRAVLPRELSLSQISELTTPAIVPTEVFIHGAMCVSVSGRCLLGAYISKRHPNRGDCSQPCRWKYTLSAQPADAAQSLQTSVINGIEDPEGSYFMNSRDLCTIDLLAEIIATGVSSLKIEGRNKSAHYVGTVVKAYRAALNHYSQAPRSYTPLPEWNSLLNSVEHRPYTTGFYGNEMHIQEISSSKAAAVTRIIGIVKALLPGGIPVLDVKNSFSCADTVEIVPVNHRLSPYHTVINRLTDLSGNELTKTPSNRLAIISTPQKLQVGDMLRRPVKDSRAAIPLYS